jgi:FkbM family methyltransferase
MVKLWPKARIIVFEPNPHAFSILKKNIKNSTAKNVEVHNLALHNYNGLTPLYVCYGMKGDNPAYEYASSVLPLTPEMQIYCKGVRIETPCVVLDDWCREAGIDHVDVLKLELEGLELPVLESSPNILKDVKVIYIKTIIHPHRVGMTQYEDLRRFLEKSNFVLLSHWYQPQINGYAIFLSREIFDAYFKLSLGIYLDI